MNKEKYNGENGKINCGIKCAVEHCVHHTTQDYCTVDTVQIGNRNAICEEETVCSSFKSNR